ncbi:MAG: RNase A-like domain-containing protein [Vicinamibacterales bacterium]
MTPRSARRTVPASIRIVLLHLMLLAAALAGACGSREAAPAPSNPPPVGIAEPGAARKSSAGPASQGYDLAADERRGGHTLERHTGKTDAELAERLRRERQISAASTYTDAATASRVVRAALTANRDRVNAWAARSGSRPNLVLVYRDPGPGPIGRSLNRKAKNARNCSSARVVIRWQERDGRWIVLTSYPETP